MATRQELLEEELAMESVTQNFYSEYAQTDHDVPYAIESHQHHFEDDDDEDLFSFMPPGLEKTSSTAGTSFVPPKTATTSAANTVKAPTPVRRRTSYAYPDSPTHASEPKHGHSMTAAAKYAASIQASQILATPTPKASSSTISRAYSKQSLSKSDHITLNTLTPQTPDEKPSVDWTGLSELDEDSPYAEVRASVSNVDDPEMPSLTFRSWFLGFFFILIGASLNVFFTLRYPAPLFTPILVQVLSYPAGKLMAVAIPPGHSYATPQWLQKIGCPPRWSFNNGPFNIKEHTVIIIMANASIGPPYALNIALVLDKYYGIPQGFAFDFLLILTTQILGFSLAGICRRFLVWPASLVWPQNLVYCTVFNTFHAEDDDEEGGISRFGFFSLVMTLAGLWYIVPGFLFIGLSAFSWVCWIWPRSTVVNQLFGVVNGLGMSMITLDWSQISYVSSPLIVPWWAEVNIFVGFVAVYWILTPILYYTNTWKFGYMPISSSEVFDKFTQAYNVTKIMTPSITFNRTAYDEYSPLYFTTTYVTIYAIAFTLATAAIVHTLLYHGQAIWARLKKQSVEDEDVHAKLMRYYPETPDWWYACFLVVVFGMSVAVTEIWQVGMPVWALMLSLLLAAIYVIPAGFIAAISNQNITINILAEVVPGYVLPGKPIANMIFKTYTVQSLNAGVLFVQDLKLGHYMKIPPRVTFWIQIIGSVVAAIVQVGAKTALKSLVPTLCEQNQKDRLTCPINLVFFNSSIVWGLIGPQRIFGDGSQYHVLLYCLIIGFFLPIIFYLLARRYPDSWLNLVNIPVLLAGIAFIPPATGINYSSWFLVGFVFQYCMRRRRFRWWSKYNFVLSAGLEGGTVVSALLVFFCLGLPRDGTISLKWWGNRVFKETADFHGVTLLETPPEGF